jgi:hypothetical protein
VENSYKGIFCKSGRFSGIIAPSVGQTFKQIPQSIQPENSIQFQLVPLAFLPEPGKMQATGQATTQSAIPSHVSVTIVYGISDFHIFVSLILLSQYNIVNL